MLLGLSKYILTIILEDDLLTCMGIRSRRSMSGRQSSSLLDYGT